MGFFNTLYAHVSCPVCKVEQLFDIQFKYGATRQYDFPIGSKIWWDGGKRNNDEGTPARHVWISGISGPCSKCKTDFLNFKIELKENQIVKVEPVEGNKEFGEDVALEN